MRNSSMCKPAQRAGAGVIPMRPGCGLRKVYRCATPSGYTSVPIFCIPGSCIQATRLRSPPPDLIFSIKCRRTKRCTLWFPVAGRKSAFKSPISNRRNYTLGHQFFCRRSYLVNVSPHSTRCIWRKGERLYRAASPFLLVPCESPERSCSI
jgi:hypothetical protein